MYFATVSLWLSLLTKCKNLYVLSVGRGKYLASTVNPISIVAEQMYTTSELSHQYQIMFILQFNNFTQLKSEFTYHAVGVAHLPGGLSL